MKIFIGFLVAIAVLFVGYKIKYPTYSWRQKITVVVDTPSGPVSGSSVSTASWTRRAIDFGGFGWSYDSQGEAIAVNLGNNRYLFALLIRPPNYEYIGSVAPASIYKLEGRPTNEKLFREVSGQRGRSEGQIIVPDYQWPLMVTFTDKSNPLSIRLVNPKNLKASFGAGYVLKSVTLQITDEPVTDNHIEVMLPWLKTIGGGMLDGRSISTLKAENRLANDLTLSDFKRTSR